MVLNSKSSDMSDAALKRLTDQIFPPEVRARLLRKCGLIETGEGEFVPAPPEMPVTRRLWEIGRQRQGKGERNG